jgi:acyl transferase domain-containing protein
MACLFPGAPDLATYWANVRAGFDAISAVPPARIDPVFFDRAARGADRFYCQRGGFVDAFASFDATGFGVMPVAARGAEPDQLLTLQVAARAMADAGYADRSFARDRTGVILGRGGYAGAGRTRLEQHVRTAEQIVTTLRALLPDLDAATLARVKSEFQGQLGAAGADAAIGLVPNLAASRVAHRLDLHGPAFTVDAACASALVAVDQACRELETKRCDVVLCGGVHLCQDEAFWSVFCQLGALSRNETIRPFDRRADGLLIGEGIGIVVLKRLEDAEKDGDRIYAVVRGCGSASDGRGATLMSPSVEGQVLAVQRAWLEAGLDPASVGLLEAHGTGTPAGDAAELTTLARVFGAAKDGEARAVVGSVKSMIGHTMPAAGAAGLIKAALAVHHRVLPPTLHCEEPQDLLAATRFRVLGREEAWSAGAEPRRAGINAFGFGGINAHVVLEEHAPSAAPRASVTAVGSAPAERMAVFSAPTFQELAADVAAGRERTGGGVARAVVIGPTPERLAKGKTIIDRGKAWRGRDGVWFSPRGLVADGGTLAFVFPGVDASFEPHVDDVAKHFGLPLPPCTVAKNLEEVGTGIIGVNRLLDGVLRGLGVIPRDVLGHSIGEWSGMIATDMIPEAALNAFMGSLKPGTLDVPGVVFAAAGCGSELAEKAMAGLPSIGLSHDNCPHQVILCGIESSIDVALERIRAEGVLCQKLPFQSGFHSPLFEDYLGPHRENFMRLPLEAPKAPLWSATSCARYPEDPAAIRELALEHLVRPVRFRQLVEALYAQGTRVFVQVGTGSLVNFVEDTLRGRPHFAMSANVKDKGGMEQLRRLLAAVFVEGVDVDFSRVSPRAPTTMPLALGVPLVRSAQALATRLETRVSAATAKANPEASSVIESHPLAAEFEGTMTAIADAQREVFALFAAPRKATLGPRERTFTHTLSIETMPELIDHSFFRQPPGWKTLSDRHPVVPMTTSIDLMLEHAGLLVPELVPIAIEDVRAYRWLVVSTPVDAKITCKFDGKDRVHVRIGDYSEATVVLASAYPAAPPDDVAPVANGARSEISAATMYGERWMFHGPQYQCITDVGTLGDDGIRGELESKPARGALLDNAGQLFGYWVMVRNEKNRMAMPVRIMKIAFYGAHPAPGEALTCSVRIRSMDEKAVIADLTLSDRKSGRAWAVIEGWEDRRFETDERLWPVMRWPEENMLAVPQAEGFVLFEDKYRGAPTRDQLSRRFLGEGERADYERQGPRKQRAWLSGRIAAKDAVRDLLWRGGQGPLFPVELTITSEASGRPIVHFGAGRDVRVSIAHKEDIAVAIAREGKDVGIDVERIEPRSDAFAEISFTKEELRLVEGEPRDVAWTRLWAAKEAAAKAQGTGLEGQLRRFPIRDRAGERLLVGDVWIETKRHGDFIISWTVA